MTANVVPIRRQQFLERPLPSAEDAERAILGAVLIDDRLIAAATEELTAEDFYSPVYRRIFAAMVALFEAKQSIDPINIGEELKKSGPIESLGGLSIITNLTYGLPIWNLDSSDTIRGYCKTVKRKSRERELIRICDNLVATAMEEGDEDVLELAQQTINGIATNETKKPFRSIGEIAVESLHHIAELRDGKRKADGLTTGLSALDFKTGGLRKSDLIILAGRPGMGKSALAGQIALNVCEKNEDVVVAIFSLEMSSKQYTDRLLATRASVDLQRMQRGALNDDEMKRVTQAVVGFNELRFAINDESVVSGAQIRSQLLRMKYEQKRIDMVIIDFLQRMSAGRSIDNRNLEVSKIAKDLKSIAKDFDCPVIALSSLNRECEKRNPPRPRSSDLRDSGDIESEADLITFIYRPAVYDNTANPRTAELIIDKHRHGPTGTVDLNFMGEFTRFTDAQL